MNIIRYRQLFVTMCLVAIFTPFGKEAIFIIVTGFCLHALRIAITGKIW